MCACVCVCGGATCLPCAAVMDGWMELKRGGHRWRWCPRKWEKVRGQMLLGANLSSGSLLKRLPLFHAK